ncbi:MAG: NDP-sugar synthase [Deltaproteobacteria bacterium]|jgi:mannose-1-phosphate guanylyltransferase|nr:NDP-sugar synthase [Deltaproteobacteria bacterium]
MPNLTSAPIREAVILAAGLGRRLAPLTTILPKPALPVLNESMLWRWLVKARALGIVKIAVNAHYLPDFIKAEVELAQKTFPDLELSLSYEPVILGTGGGVKVAAADFKGPFLVINADIYTTLDLSLLIKAHFEKKAWVTLAVLDYPEKATVSLDQDFRIIGLRSPKPCLGEVTRLCGLGILVMETDFRDSLPLGYSDLIEELSNYLPYQGVWAYLSRDFWSDMGTVASYWALNAYLAQNQVIRAPGAEVLGETEGFVVLGSAARIERGAKVINSVLWPGAVAPPGSVVREAILAGRAPTNKEVIDVWLGN